MVSTTWPGKQQVCSGIILDDGQALETNGRNESTSFLEDIAKTLAETETPTTRVISPPEEMANERERASRSQSTVQ